MSKSTARDARSGGQSRTRTLGRGLPADASGTVSGPGGQPSRVAGTAGGPSAPCVHGYFNYCAICGPQARVIDLNSTIVLDQPAQIEAWRLLAVYYGLRLELQGLRHSSGRRASVVAREIMGKAELPAPRNRQALLQEFEKHLVKAGLLKLDRYTAFIGWDGEPDATEEIDVDATSRADAIARARAILARDYRPGGRVIQLLGPREGLYL